MVFKQCYHYFCTSWLYDNSKLGTSAQTNWQTLLPSQVIDLWTGLISWPLFEKKVGRRIWAAVKNSSPCSGCSDTGMKCGCARDERYVASMRNLIRQHRTRAVSHHVLANLLKMRSEHLWTCSLCNDDDLLTRLTNHNSKFEMTHFFL